MALVTLDLDGTLIEPTMFQAAADGLGFGEEVERYDRHFFRGTLSLLATFYVEYDLFLGRPVQAIHEALEQGPWLEGIDTTVQALRARGCQVWVVTDQPSWATSFLARFGIEQGVWSTCATRNGKVGACTDLVHEKWPALEAKLEAHGIDPSEVCHVGNGSNDVPIFEQVGYALAVNPSGPEVSQAADLTLSTRDLGAILEPVDAWLEC